MDQTTAPKAPTDPAAGQLRVTLDHTDDVQPPTIPATEAHKRIANSLSETSFYRAINRGDIPAIKIGGRWLVLREPFEALLRGEEVSPSQH